MSQKKTLVILLTSLLPVLIQSSPLSFAEVPTSAAEIIENGGRPTITGLTWKDYHPKVEIEATGEGTTTSIILEGVYTRADWSLIGAVNRIISRGTNGDFTFKTPISKDALAVDFMAIGPLGEIEKQKVVLLFSGWEEQKKNTAKAPPKRAFSSVGMGLTSLSHTETGLAPYSSLALTAKGGFNYLLFPPKWDLGLSGYITALQLSKTSGIGARFYGFNARMGYILQNVPEPWRISIYGGMYYTSMMVAGDAFGFKNLAGPQIYPAVRRTLKKGDAIAMYAKFSPVASNFSLLSFSSREIATGIAYIHPLPKGRTLSATFDFATIQLLIGNASVKMSTATLGGGIGF